MHTKINKFGFQITIIFCGHKKFIKSGKNKNSESFNLFYDFLVGNSKSKRLEFYQAKTSIAGIKFVQSKSVCNQKCQ